MLKTNLKYYFHHKKETLFKLIDIYNLWKQLYQFILYLLEQHCLEVTFPVILEHFPGTWNRELHFYTSMYYLKSMRVLQSPYSRLLPMVVFAPLKTRYQCKWAVNVNELQSPYVRLLPIVVFAPVKTRYQCKGAR